MTNIFENQTIFITGASSGLGVQMAKRLAGKGAAVALAARRTDRLADVKAEIESKGGKAAAIAFDVEEVGGIDAALDSAERALGPVTALVNNAGLNIQASAQDFKPEQYDTVFSVNLRGAFFLATACARRWTARRYKGRVLNIASLSAYHTVPMITPYAMSKAAMVHMTACLAREWARAEIAVNAIAPGYLRTEINDHHWDTPEGQKLLAKFPRRRVGEASDIDGAVLLLLDPAQRFITGQTLIVDDGQGLG